MPDHWFDNEWLIEQIPNECKYHSQVGDIGKKGWSTLAGSNSFSGDGGYSDVGSNYQSGGSNNSIRNSNTHNIDDDWGNDQS